MADYSYPAITDMLKGDPSLGLHITGTGMNFGISSLRTAEVSEPNQYENLKSPNNEPRRAKNFLYAQGKDTVDALGFLEAKCGGWSRGSVESPLRSGNGCSWPKVEGVHGHAKSQGGLDNWMNAGHYIRACGDGDSICLSMDAYGFPYMHHAFQGKFSDIGDALRFFKKNDVDPSIPIHLQKGLQMMHETVNSMATRTSADVRGYDVLGKMNAEENREVMPLIDQMDGFGFSNEIKNAVAYSVISHRLFRKE